MKMVKTRQQITQKAEEPKYIDKKPEKKCVTT